MMNSLLEAISQSLNAEFGDLEIYMEHIEQGFNEPCFFVSCISSKISHSIGNRYYAQSEFCIHFFPSTVEQNRECHSAAQRLYDCMEYIKVDGEERPTRGTNMHHEITDNILHFYVNFDFYVTKTQLEEWELMEEMHKCEHMKGCGKRGRN